MATASFSYFPGQEYLAKQFCGTDTGDASQGEANQPRAPPGFPSLLQSPLAWTRAEIEQSIDECVVHLSADDVFALESATKNFIAEKTPLQHIKVENFVLPTDFARRLRGISENCYHGRGFTVVKTLDPAKYSPEENVVIYAGLTAYVAPQHGFLNKDCTKVICHVVNAAEASPLDEIKNSPGLSDSALAFHTDTCEVLALYAMDMATTGGQTYVSSAYQLFNELAVQRPDVLQTLSDYWVLDSFRDYSKYPPITRPFLHVANGENVMFTYSRFPMAGFKDKPRNPELPAPTAAQIEAMDTVQYLMAKNALPLPWVKGDMVFINDMAVMHARSAFQENATGLQRHLVKFYLRDPAQNWPVPATAQDHWDKVYGPNNVQGGRDEQWCLKYEEGSKGDGWQSNG